MVDEPEVTPIHLVQSMVLVMESAWPERTSFTEDLLNSAYLRGAVYDPQADTMTFDIFNGGAIYLIRRDLPSAPGSVIADLVPDSARKTTRRP